MSKKNVIIFLISFLFMFSCSDKPQKAKIEFPLKFSSTLKDNSTINFKAIVELKDNKSLRYFKKREKKIVHGLDLSFRVLIERQINSEKKVEKALKKFLKDLTNKEIVKVSINDLKLIK